MPAAQDRVTAAIQRWRVAFRRLAASDFVRKVSETFGTQLLLLVVGFATTVAVARSLGPAGRGLYAIMVAVGAIGVQFGNLGLHVSNTYYVAKDRKLLPAVAGNAIFVSIVLGGFCAVIVGALSYVRPSISPLPRPLLVLALAWIPVGLCYLLVRNLLLAIMEVRWYNKLELQNRLLACSILGALILTRRLSVTGAFLAMAAGFSLGLSRGILRLYRAGHRFARPSLSLLAEHVPLGMRGYVICLFSFLVLRIDLLMVKYYLGSEQAGYYSIAATLADYVLLLPAVIGSILFPKLSAQTDNLQKFNFAKTVTFWTAVLLLPLVAVCGLAATRLVQFIFGRAFLPAAWAFVWLLPGVFLLGVQTVAVQFLNSLGYPKIVIAAWGLTTLLNVGLNLWAIPAHGIVGASVVSSITYSAVCVMVLVIIYRRRRYLEIVPLEYAPAQSF